MGKVPVRDPSPPLLEAETSPADIRRVYDLGSSLYGLIAVTVERGAARRSLECAEIGPRERVLEVGVGPGVTFGDILKRVERTNFVQGVDFSPRMLAQARGRVRSSGFSNFVLYRAEARRLPFREETFDLLYSGYLLDLTPLGDMPDLLREFRRVLRPGGRLVLLCLSRKDRSRRTLWERIYARLPARWIPYVLGGCRPVLMEGPVREAGFYAVHRELVSHFFFVSEVLRAKKPPREGAGEAREGPDS